MRYRSSTRKINHSRKSNRRQYSRRFKGVKSDNKKISKILKYIKEKSASLSKLMNGKSLSSVGKHIASTGIEAGASILKVFTPIPGELITQAKKWANRKLGTK